MGQVLSEPGAGTSVIDLSDPTDCLWFTSFYVLSFLSDNIL